jgi:hypothetical protein
VQDLDLADYSAFFTFPSILTTSPFVVLKLCFATLEMGSSPVIEDFWVLQDTMTIITAPRINSGLDARALTGSSPDFVLVGAAGTGGWGVDGGDYVYLKSSCSGLLDQNQEYATVPIRLQKFEDAVLGT